jgi:xanthine dehydrogenase accessory factor
MRVFVDPIVPSPQLVVIGAVHIAVALTTMARAAGFTVSVVDPRSAFNNAERIPDAERLIVAWPDEALLRFELGPRDAAVCLAHDPKFEDPALTSLLRSETGYIGAIGSRGTHAKRVARLREAGFSDTEIARIHSPVGLNLGAATPEEIAIAILAEIVAVRRGRNAGSLSAQPATPVG